MKTKHFSINEEESGKQSYIKNNYWPDSKKFSLGGTRKDCLQMNNIFQDRKEEAYIDENFFSPTFTFNGENWNSSNNNKMISKEVEYLKVEESRLSKDNSIWNVSNYY